MSPAGTGPTDGDAPILAAAPGAVDWPLVLRWYMRALAVLSIARGLLQWAVICGLPSEEGIGFEDLALGHQGAVVFFAVMEPVAGVGLWMTAVWGSVVFILATAVALAIDLTAFAGAEGWVLGAARPAGAGIGDVALLGFYGLAAFFAARQMAGRASE